MAIRFVLSLCVSFLYFFPPNIFADSACQDWQELTGEYAVVEVSRYRGGLTSLEEAKGRIGEKAIVAERNFSIWDKEDYIDPHYEIACYPVPQEEGEVPMPWERRGNFYGFGVDREVITVFSVTPEKEEGPRYHFEVVSDELWFFFDGWLYQMKRVGRD